MGGPEPPYIIILTAREGKDSIVKALDGGADDFLTKPFNRDELQARLRVGRRIVDLQTTQTAIFTFARAVDAKDKDALFSALNDIDQACEGCHVRYWYPNDQRAVQGAKEAGILE